MLFGVKKTLYDHITEALLEKSGTVSDITFYLESKKVIVTFQGIYKALKELIAEDVVIKQGKKYLIHNSWRNKATEHISSGEHEIDLFPDEKMTYQFKKVSHVDVFWKHTWIAIEKNLKNTPVVEYIPHQFWIYITGRKESEYEYYATLKNNKTAVYTNIGGDSVLDKMIKKSMEHEYHQINIENNLLFNHRDHMVIVGPYVINTRISKTFADQVGLIYTETSDETVLEEKLNRIFEKPGSTVLTLEHNIKKAARLRKSILKNFYISKEIQEKYLLF